MKNIAILKGKKIVNKESGAIRLVVDVNEEFNKLYVIPVDKEDAAPVPMAYASFTRRWEILEETTSEESATETAATEAPAAETTVAEEPTPEESAIEEPEVETPDEIVTPTGELVNTNETKMSEVVGKLEELFNILNRVYFEDSLPKPVITVQSTPKAYGHCSTKKIWQGENESRYEINIGAEYLNRPTANTAATMCHEMIHLFCRENNINETCQNGRYHNKTFKTEAEKRGLVAGYDRANGYTHTEPTDEFKKALEDNGFELEVLFARIPPKEKAKAQREKAHSYICPCCQQKVRSTSILDLICGICNVPMEAAD